jgi:hypothetical protein
MFIWAPSTKAAIDAIKLSNSRKWRAWKSPYGLKKRASEKPTRRDPSG